jgi:hypothetical protein
VAQIVNCGVTSYEAHEGDINMLWLVWIVLMQIIPITAGVVIWRKLQREEG